ncbi:hypothetical protein Acr_24g0006390 [Actinidia rufa]|uniref:Uncharacterized protein n=1 Tax=Actinidia rufa TaxID=165716 RepID=A0A7J0GUE1_9ERIC|nr:hypothetical protein Acr_24g0006390 [Actinidia rufa]
MGLNKSQLLVRDDTALNKFQTNNIIPKGEWEFQAGDDGLWSFLRYNSRLPDTTDSNAGLKIEVMLPKDIVDLAKEGYKEIKDLMVMQQVQAKLALATTDQLKADLATVEHARDASYTITTLAQNEAAVAGAQKDKALQDLAELQAVAYGPVYDRLSSASLNITQLGISPSRRVARGAQVNEATEPKGEVPVEEAGEMAAEAVEAAVEVRVAAP